MLELAEGLGDQPPMSIRMHPPYLAADEKLDLQP
jgi:hypothetical protein